MKNHVNNNENCREQVYSWTGAQIISPEDKNIEREIDKNLEPWKDSWNTTILTQSKDVTEILAQTYDSYMKILVNSIPKKYLMMNCASKMSFAYSAMHGVGYESIQKAMDYTGLKIIPVMEQRDPDPEFPTVK